MHAVYSLHEPFKKELGHQKGQQIIMHQQFCDSSKTKSYHMPMLGPHKTEQDTNQTST